MRAEPPPNVAYHAYPVAVPDWIPVTGHRLGRVGERFDAVRVAGLWAEEVADSLVTGTGGLAGPIVREATGHRWMYFLLPPGTVTGYRWPPGVTRFGRTTAAVYVGVPALRGESWPLSWRSAPCHEAPFVDPGLLHETLCLLPCRPGA